MCEKESNLPVSKMLMFTTRGLESVSLDADQDCDSYRIKTRSRASKEGGSVHRESQ